MFTLLLEIIGVCKIIATAEMRAESVCWLLLRSIARTSMLSFELVQVQLGQC